MGAFGTGIFENDLSLDVRGDYEELLEENDNDHRKAYRELIKKYGSEMKSYVASDEADFWFAVAEMQMKDKALLPEVKDKCMNLLVNRDIFELWGDDEGTFNERIDALTAFVKRLKATR